MSLDPARHAARSILAVVSLLVVAGLAPGMTATAAPSSGVTSRQVDHVTVPGAAVSGPRVDPTPLEPTIQYEEAVAHERDRIAFAPGERVRVAFTPRAGDTWQVAGGSPRALPAGRLTGHAMRAARDVPAPPATSSLDRPIVPAADVVAARGAVFNPDDGTGGIQLVAAVDPGALRREVFGFLPYWELASSSTTFDWETLSTIAYFGVGADASGNLMKRNTDGSTTVSCAPRKFTVRSSRIARNTVRYSRSRCTVSRVVRPKTASSRNGTPRPRPRLNLP